MLRSRSSKRQIIKATKSVISQVCVSKRAHPPIREDTSKKKCTRNKSPGFSDDDDMPLNKITLNNINSKVKELESDNVRLSMIAKSLEKDDVPLEKKTAEGIKERAKQVKNKVTPKNKSNSNLKQTVKGEGSDSKGDVDKKPFCTLRSAANRVMGNVNFIIP